MHHQCCFSRSYSAFLLLEIILSAYLIIQLKINQCQAQLAQNIVSQQQQQQLQYALQLHKQQINSNLTSQKATIQRPNLPVNNQTIDNNFNQNEMNVLTEAPADWLLMGGGQDLLPEEGRNVASFADGGDNYKSSSSRKSGSGKKRDSKSKSSQNKTMFDDDSQQDSSESNEVFDEGGEGDLPALAGSNKAPECAGSGRYYCTFKEEYPIKLVTEVTKYYKWPLEKLFRDLHAQIMPKLAQDSTGNLVCDSITRVVRPGWSRNTNDKWLVVINTENYHQYVTEVVCQYGSNSRCNFIPPCYYSSCQQRYNTQKLLVIDPTNPYRGPFLSEFLFPSCCVCYVPSAKDSFQDKYRSSPATIYQRTMQQESANNIYPPKFRPGGLLEDQTSVMADQSADSLISTSSLPSGLASVSDKQTANQPLGPGEIRRSGELYSPAPKRQLQQYHEEPSETAGSSGSRSSHLSDFPRLDFTESLVSPTQGKNQAN